MNHLFRLLCFVVVLVLPHCSWAQTLSASNVRIEWKVENRFRLFRDVTMFRQHESAWQQYLIHVDNLSITQDEKDKLIARSSVIGTEHVLNDRYIPFTKHLRSKYDWRGWAAAQRDQLCWDQNARGHSACGSVESFLNPKSYEISAWLDIAKSNRILGEQLCEWLIDGKQLVTAACDEPVTLNLSAGEGGEISVAVQGEQPISTVAQVKDLLFVGLGDSFASGEGNPDMPVVLDSAARSRNVYPKRAINDASGDARWIDEECHRSLYSYQLRATLQIAIENPRTAVTFLGYACSGAAVEDGILGPQTYVDYQSSDASDENADIRSVSGNGKDSQIYRLLHDLCEVAPEKQKGLWHCPENQLRRPVDYVLLSVGGNDIGFSNLVAWVTLKSSVSARLAKFFGATVSADQFRKNMEDTLPGAYAKLARALETAVPMPRDGLRFDASRVILSAYPDILSDENDKVCHVGESPEVDYAANQSLDFFSSWLNVNPRKINAASAQIAELHRRMRSLAGDHGWTFAGRAYEDRAFRGRGFCAQNRSRMADATEVLIMPCWGKAKRATATCEWSLSSKQRDWRPYNPQNETYPYALRQRWVRTFNDAYLMLNSKVIDRSGRIDERASQRVFSETTGAMHPSAEGHAAMADAILMDLRKQLQK